MHVHKKIDIKFNAQNSEHYLYKENHILSDILDITNFKESLKIIKSYEGIIKANKIKNKKDLYILSEKENIILQKTTKLNEKGFFL